MANVADATALLATGPFVALDTETTGIPRTDPDVRVWEVGAVRIDEHGAETSSFSRLIALGAPLPDEIATLSGVPADLPVREGEPAAVVLADLLAFIGEAPIAGHSLRDFDEPMLAAEFARAGLTPPAQFGDRTRLIDTIRLCCVTWRGHRGGPARHRLGEAAAFLGCPTPIREHRAVDDARTCAAILRAIVAAAAAPKAA